MYSLVTGKPNEETDSVGDVIDALGFGRFTILLITLVGITWISDATELNVVSILGPELRCVWNLTSFETSVSSVTVFVGEGIGALCFGYLGDIHGRKKVLVAGSVMIVIFGGLSSAAPSYSWYLLLRFFVGIGVGSAVFATTYTAEFIEKSHRGKALILLDLFYALGSFYVAALALLLMRSAGWRIYLVCSTFPALIFVTCSFWLPESLHFLGIKGDYDKIKNILRKISKWNGTEIDKAPRVQQVSSSKTVHWQLLITQEYLWKICILLFISITSICSYYGAVMLNTEFLQMSDSCIKTSNNYSVEVCHRLSSLDYKNNIVVTASEFPSVILLMLLVDKVGRKPCLILGFVLSGIGFVLLNSCYLRKSVIVMFVLRFILIALSQIPYLLAAELVPTVIRATTLGVVIFSVKVGLTGVPFLVQSLVHQSLLATTLVFSVPSFVSVVLVCFLPETSNKELVSH